MNNMHGFLAQLILLICTSAWSFAEDNSPLFPLPAIICGEEPRYMEVVDLNLDGLVDLIVSNSSSNNLFIYYANSKSGFEPPVEIPTNPLPLGVTPADLNNDGLADLLVCSVGTSTVEVFLQQMDGSFGSPTSYSGFAFPTRTRVSDLNDDGNLDVIANGSFGHVSNSYISVFLGNGDGTLQPAVSHYGVHAQEDILLKDLNGDERSDLICIAFNGVFSMYTNTDGTLKKGDDIAPDAQAQFAQLADLDGDGEEDLVVATTSPNSLRVYLGRTGGSFTPADVYPLSDQPMTLACGDVNADGIIDITTSIQPDNYMSEVLIFTGVGDATFETQHSYFSGDEPVYQLIFDYNRDGLQDIATLSQDDGQLSIATSTLAAELLLPDETDDSGIDYVHLIADFNNDHRPDLILNEDGQDQQMYIRTALEDGGYGEPVLIGENIFLGYEMEARDINSDGYKDLIVQFSSSLIAYYLNTGSGTFSSRQTFPSSGRPNQFRFVDFSRDGLDDIVISDVFEERLAFIQLDEVLDPESPVFFDLPARCNSFAFSDFNADSIPDLAVQIRDLGHPIYIYLGEEDGSYSQVATFDTDYRSRDMRIDDFNLDGYPDILLQIGTPPIISILFGGTELIFSEPEFIYLARDGHSLELVDINQDTYPDIILGNVGASNFTVVPSQLDAYPERVYPRAPSVFYTGRVSGTRSLLDVDQDGDLDMLYNNLDRTLAISENQLYSSVNCTADLNNDGDLNFFDVSAFMVAFNDTDPAADFNDDGMFNFFDVSAFLSAFIAGCP